MLLKEPMEFGFETDLWTTERVARVMKKFGIHYHSDHARRRILRNSLNFSPQKPEGIARERGAKKRRNWVKNVLPEIEKG
jgi:transposase